jgi:hypothetical protein
MTSPAYIHESALLTTSQWQRSAAQPRCQPVTQLCRLDGKVIAEASVSFISGDRWAWIVETVARETECREDQVGCVETDEGDVVTVDGIPVYRLIGC